MPDMEAIGDVDVLVADGMFIPEVVESAAIIVA